MISAREARGIFKGVKSKNADFWIEEFLGQIEFKIKDASEKGIHYIEYSPQPVQLTAWNGYCQEVREILINLGYTLNNFTSSQDDLIIRW